MDLETSLKFILFSIVKNERLMSYVRCYQRNEDEMFDIEPTAAGLSIVQVYF